MKVYITKCALTKGIFTRDCSISDVGNGKMVSGKAWNDYYHKPNWHTSRVDAVTQAEKMRAAKIAPLKKQIAKLEAMTFEVADKEVENGKG